MTVNLLAHARRLAAHPARWPVRPRFDTTERWYARLSAGPDHEAWLLAWRPGHDTEWHDHGGSAGAFVVVSGQLREDTPNGSRRLTADMGRQFGARHIHRVINDGAAPAVSVHVYAPALTMMTRYDVVGGDLRVRSVERAGADW
jgi:mannose-6-phosphate isomerase-like protein (cupin superfamily)